MELPANAKSGSQIVTFKPPLDESTRKWQLSSTDIIEEVRMRLAGHHFSENQNKWIKICEPRMNEAGIGSVIYILNMYINKNMQLSYFEPEIIENMTIGFSKSYSFYLQYFYADYGIKKEDVDMIYNMVCDTVYASLMRARFGKESQFIENTEQRTITQIEGNQQGQQSPISRIPILGRFAK